MLAPVLIGRLPMQSRLIAAQLELSLNDKTTTRGIMKALLLACLSIIALSSCGKSEETPTVSSATYPNAPTANALPFSIENVMLSDMFQNNLKVAKVYVGINGGTAAEWSATSIAIAEKVAMFGADSIEVSVSRDEVKQARGVRFREVAHAYYSPNPAHTVWDGDPKWKVLQADPTHLATQQDVIITEDFDALNQGLIDRGMDNDAADRKAGAAIAKKYHLPKEWMLPVGNTLRDVPRESMNVDAGPASAALASLDKCMNGKIIRVFTTCDN